jgi:hypothetical protein
MAAAPAARPVVRLLRLAGVPIYEQLLLEEALLRASSENWFVLNDGSSTAAIVLGISGCDLVMVCGAPKCCIQCQIAPTYHSIALYACRKPQELVHAPSARAAGLQAIRRFSGGGTVVVDEGTIFSSLIMQVRARHVFIYGFRPPDAAPSCCPAWKQGAEVWQQ